MFINKLNNKDNVLYLLAILLFNSVYLGNLIIHISILFAFIYALFFIKEINLDITDKCLIIFGLYLIVSFGPAHSCLSSNGLYLRVFDDDKAMPALAVFKSKPDANNIS